ncbi:DUF1631 domain-containing protein [Agaribacterium haliotis]|uniref:DUF1631 domain-containing protein n=1 Tax=Agaribacterium haliotis TaxID=2013869 RepID=UPI000BB57A1A|nr:DUF1631 domain-containing protein [Agaribacterium haliotis]
MSNIVALNGGKEANEPALAAQLARLPEPVKTVRDLAMPELAAMLKLFFERADDALFELADKAGSNEEQNFYFDSMRELRLRRHVLESSFQGEIDTAFAILLDEGGQRDTLSKLKADALTLVEHDDLDALVAVDTAVARANATHGEAMQFLALRLDSLVPVKVYQKNMPVGADVLYSAFMGRIKALGLGIKAKLHLFRVFERCQIELLAGLYTRLNESLVQKNVLPSLGRAAEGGAAARAKVRGAARKNHGEFTSSAHPAQPASADTALASSSTAAQRARANTGIDAEQSQELAHLFAEQGLSQQDVFVSPEQLQQNSFVQALNALQNSPELQMAEQINAQQLKQLLLKQAGSPASASPASGAQPDANKPSQTPAASAVDEQVMLLVASLFEVILDNDNLPKVMKDLLSRLQIPIIKVAIADKTFFTQSGHVARRLLNEMATAAIGWEARNGEFNSDPLYKKISSIVKTLMQDFELNTEIFSDLLADFSAFQEKDRKRIALLERRTRDAEEGKAKAELARAAVAVEIEQRCAEFKLPEVLDKIINEAWSNVLFVAALKSGGDSDIWAEHLATLDALLASVQAPADASERSALIKSVPPLLKKIRAGLDTISYNPFEMSSLFKGLEAIHLECIRGGSPVKRHAELAQQELEQTHALGAEQKQHAEPEPKPESGAMGKAIGKGPVSGSERSAQLSQGQKSAEPANKNLASPSQAASTSSVQTAESEGGSAAITAEQHALLLKQVRAFVQGAWFEMQLQSQGASQRARLAAFIKPTGKYIFVDRSGKKVAENTEAGLVTLLAQKRLKPLDNSLLFDKALETIVSGLRPKN